jgi:hypothetical protein
LLGAAPAATQPPAVTDLPFIGQIIRLRSTTVDLLKIVHRHVKDQRVVGDFDDKYDLLQGSVNDLFKSIAFDLQHNTPHDSDWQQAANDILQNAKDFANAARAISTARRQAGPTYRGGIPGGMNIEWSPKEKKVLLTYQVDFDKARQEQADIQAKAFEEQLQLQEKAAQAQQTARNQFAADLLRESWPARCAVGLERPACPNQQNF